MDWKISKLVENAIVKQAGQTDRKNLPGLKKTSKVTGLTFEVFFQNLEGLSGRLNVFLLP